MTDHHNVSGELLDTGDRDSRSYALGLLLSRIFHPVFLNIFMFLIVGYYAMATRVQGLIWASACIVVMVIPPTLFFSWRLRQGAYSDEDVSVRQQRTELYLFGLATVTIGMIVLSLLGLPRPFLALLASAFVIGVLGVVINTFWKISVHAGSIATTATVASLYSNPLGIVLWVCAFAVGWARIRTGNHTPTQVVAGMLLSAAMVLLVFRIML